MSNQIMQYANALSDKLLKIAQKYVKGTFEKSVTTHEQFVQIQIGNTMTAPKKYPKRLRAFVDEVYDVLCTYPESIIYITGKTHKILDRLYDDHTMVMSSDQHEMLPALRVTVDIAASQATKNEEPCLYMTITICATNE